MFIISYFLLQHTEYDQVGGRWRVVFPVSPSVEGCRGMDGGEDSGVAVVREQAESMGAVT